MPPRMGENEVILLLLHDAASRRPLSRVESGAKPPGESQNVAIPPDPPCVLAAWLSGCSCLAALVAEASFEFPLNAEGSLCKIAARVPLRAAVQPLEAEGKLLDLLVYREGGRALARPDEASLAILAQSFPISAKVRIFWIFPVFFRRKSLTIQSSACIMEHDFRLLIGGRFHC